MRKGFLLVSTILIAFVMQAQTNTLSPVGEYYLKGVMETASGFKLNSDSSFEFFFSYGALDRSGKGNWKIDGQQVVLNSPKRNKRDYTLASSQKIPGDGIRIQLAGGNDYINRFVKAVIKTGDKVEEAVANQRGLIVLKASSADSIELLFELCPEKSSVFRIERKELNYFEFRLESSITDVLFDNFRLQLYPDKLSGPHPLLIEKTLTYQKIVKQ